MNLTGSEVIYMIANNVFALTISHQMLRHILGPILFLLYVNDFAQYIENQNCNIFADDAMIYSFGRDIPEMESNLQCALNSLTPWYSANRLSISAQKSAVMLIGKQSQVKKIKNFLF